MKATAWASLAFAVPLALLAPLATLHAADISPTKPNIILILADDFGYGDMSCYNDRAKVPTPNP